MPCAALAASIRAAYDPFGGGFAGAAGLAGTAFEGTVFAGTGLLWPRVPFLEAGLAEAGLALLVGADDDRAKLGVADADAGGIEGRAAGDLVAG